MAGNRPDISVPPAEIRRQAAAPLAGYSYQLHQTVLAWLRLKPDETLFFEFAEDVAIADDQTLSLTQVKATQSTITLRSKPVAALIRSTWEFQKANPSRTVTAALITTGRLGKEKGPSFPGGRSGLAYWRVAARENADVEPIKQALLALDLPTDLREFISTCGDSDLQNKLLRRIRWWGSEASHDDLENELHEQLVYFGSRNGVGAQDSQNALGALVLALLRRVRKEGPQRFVTLADLATEFQKVTFRLVPPSLLEQTPAFPPTPTELADVALLTPDAKTVPLPPRLTARPNLVERLHNVVVDRGVLWLHGSSGLGKTTLALLTARQQSAPWLFADLRDADRRSLRAMLSRIGSSFGAEGPRGLILDDLPANLDNPTLLVVRRVVREVLETDGTIIITSAKPPPPVLVGALDLPPNGIEEVPYLTQTEIAEMVHAAGGDPNFWARPIFLFTGGGHPQLVDARIVGLRQRGWPTKEQMGDLLPLRERPGDLEHERSAVRSRLLDELDSQSRELLFRLSLGSTHFDQKILFAIAVVEPPIVQPGLLFESLVGPWIERIGPDQYRISPLLRDSGETSFPEEMRATVRRALLSHLMGRRPFPAEQLMEFFPLAYALKDVRALMWFAGAIAHASSSSKDFKRIAEELTVFALADRGEGEPLFPESPHISVLLRYAQMRVAIALEDSSRATKIFNRLLFELEGMDESERPGLVELAYGTALFGRPIKLPPAKWLSMLQQLKRLPEGWRLTRPQTVPNGPFGMPVQATNEEMLFIIRASTLDGLADLRELFEALDVLSAEERDKYLSAASRVARSMSHIVSSAWTAETRRGGFDARAGASLVSELRNTALAWKNTDLTIELFCAEAVLLDEYAKDREAALAVLAQGQALFPYDYRINRQRQRIYYRAGDHARALAEFEEFSNAMPQGDHVERAYAMREAGRSAAELGEMGKARRFFGDAWESARQCGTHMLPMTAGLSADCAMLDFEEGKTESALTLMRRALEESGPIDPSAGAKQHYCVLILMTAILYMRGAASYWPVERQVVVFGMCSDPNPNPEFQKRPLPPRLLPWYELASLEAEISAGQQVLAALRKRTKKGGLLPMEYLLASTLLTRTVRLLDVNGFVEILPFYARAINLATRVPRDPSMVMNPPVGVLSPVSAREWANRECADVVANPTLLFGFAAVCSGQSEKFMRLRARLVHVAGLKIVVEPLFAMMDAGGDPRGDATATYAKLLGQMLQPDFVFDAKDAFFATVHLVQLLGNHIAGDTAAVPITSYFTHVWKDILTNRPFSVRSPAVIGPMVLEAATQGATPRAQLANMSLASEAAVRDSLSDDLRARIRALANPPPQKPAEYLELEQT